MKAIAACFAPVIAAATIFLLTSSFVLVGITGIIGGFAWSHSQRNER